MLMKWDNSVSSRFQGRIVAGTPESDDLIDVQCKSLAWQELLRMYLWGGSGDAQLCIGMNCGGLYG